MLTAEVLLTRDEDLTLLAVRFLKDLAEANKYTGPALVPYYRQVLPSLSLFIKKNKNTKDAFVYDQRLGRNLGEAIAETLEAFERTGGPVRLMLKIECLDSHQEPDSYFRDLFDCQQEARLS